MSQHRLDEITRYRELLNKALAGIHTGDIELLANDIFVYRKAIVFGNGGSAANSLHFASDLCSVGIEADALTANIARLTCIANDDGYDKVFCEQMPREPCVAIGLSGSGNSKNVINGLATAKRLWHRTWAIVGFDGGAAMQIAGRRIHIPIDDMEIAEDCQLIISHMVKRCLSLF